jgi:ribonuclease BN (tRNA processing enzyme)
MKLQVLGCSGGIGAGLRTTSFLVNDSILIDAGTGIGDLPLAMLQDIEHVLVTHCHMDHIALLPMLCDTKNIAGGKPVTVYALPQTIQALKGHVFNWQIWPDFAEIPDSSEPILRWHAINEGDSLEVAGLRVRVLPANHIVPGVGYAVHDQELSFAFQGDSGSCAGFWQALAVEDVDLLIVESAFNDDEQSMAVRTKHLSPSLLAAELERYTGRARIVITHPKPGEERLVEAQIAAQLAGRNARLLRNGEVIEITKVTD